MQFRMSIGATWAPNEPSTASPAAATRGERLFHIQLVRCLARRQLPVEGVHQGGARERHNPYPPAESCTYPPARAGRYEPVVLTSTLACDVPRRNLAGRELERLTGLPHGGVTRDVQHVDEQLGVPGTRWPAISYSATRGRERRG
jgi:hypothetical protein